MTVYDGSTLLRRDLHRIGRATEPASVARPISWPVSRLITGLTSGPITG